MRFLTIPRYLAYLCIATTIAFLLVHSAIADSGGEDQAAPYFYLPDADEQSIAQFPLKHTSAKVTISGVIASVEIVQVYQNLGARPLEAIYVFPGSIRAAVHDLSMRIGERTIRASIEERNKARNIYEVARDDGKTASLLEQHRPNVFQMNLANILPQEEVTVSLSYTELLSNTDTTYEFIYPTVVGPRYSGSTEQTASWVKNPYLLEGDTTGYTFAIELVLDAGMPIQDVSSSSHAVGIEFESSSKATIRLKDSEKYAGDRDFRLQYRLAAEAPASGLLLHQGKDENFFLAMMQPPKRVKAEQVLPREYIFVIDVSGSMNGFPIETSKKLMKELFGSLSARDQFNVILFAGSSEALASRSLVATEENIRSALALIDNHQGAGATELLPALKQAFAIPQSENHSRTIVVVTDGYVDVEAQAFDLIRQNLGQANLFSFGIGSSVNRHLIEGMARVGLGEPFVVTHPNEASLEAGKFRTYIEAPVLTNIAIDFEGFDVYDVEPKVVPDVFAARPILVFGKWRGDAAGTINIRGTTATGSYAQSLAVSDAATSLQNPALRYLWARKRIELLSDYDSLSMNSEQAQELTNLGLTYNLLTAYTSFIAVDEQVRNVVGAPTPVAQPLPLPQHVSSFAVPRYNVGNSSGGFGPAGSFTEASFEDDLLRSRTNTVLTLIEGNFGALVMTISFTLGAVFLGLTFKKRRLVWLSLGCLSFGGAILALRMAVALLFSPEML